MKSSPQLLLLSTSPRGTMSFGKKLLTKFNDVTSMNGVISSLLDYNINPCTGCYECTRSGTCPINDACEKLQNEILRKQIIIFSVPVYFASVPAQLKSFFDRLLAWAHQPQLFDQIFSAIITSAGYGVKETEHLLEMIVDSWGGNWIAPIKIDITKIPDDDELSTIFKEFDLLIQKKAERIKKSPVDQIPRYFHRKIIKPIIKKFPDMYKADIEFWREKGWLK